MEFVEFSPGGELGDKVELSKELAHHLTGIVSLTQDFQTFDDAGDGVLGLGDCRVGVILALAFQALLMFQEFFPVEVGEALTTWSEIMTRRPGRYIHGCQMTTLEGHQWGVKLV